MLGEHREVVVISANLGEVARLVVDGVGLLDAREGLDVPSLERGGRVLLEVGPGGVEDAEHELGDALISEVVCLLVGKEGVDVRGVRVPQGAEGG